MKLLIDNNLSPSLAKMLRDQGLDCIHVKEIKMQAASDLEIFGSTVNCVKTSQIVRPHSGGFP